LRGEVLSFLDAFAVVLVKPLVPDCAVLTFDAGVLLRLSWLDVLDGKALFISPFQQLDADVFRAIIDRIVPGLPRHSMMRSRHRITRSAGNEKSTSSCRAARQSR
jgi:hypothetical protein